jgi:hypothetical protein
LFLARRNRIFPYYQVAQIKVNNFLISAFVLPKSLSICRSHVSTDICFFSVGVLAACILFIIDCALAVLVALAIFVSLATSLTGSKSNHLSSNADIDSYCSG